MNANWTRIKNSKLFNWLKAEAIVVQFALALILLFIFAPWLVSWQYDRIVSYSGSSPLNSVSDPNHVDRLFTLQTQLYQLAGGLAVLVGIWFAGRRIRVAERTLKTSIQTLDMAERGHFTERFSKSIEHLGSERTAIQLGGVYALEELAKERTNYHATIYEILCSFLRENCQTPSPSFDPFADNRPGDLPIHRLSSTVIIAILSILGRRSTEGEERKYLDHYLLNLRQCDLQGFDFSQSNQRAQFSKCNFQDAILTGVNFTNADLIGTNFRHTDLTGSVFKGAMLQKTLYGPMLFGPTNLDHSSFVQSTIIDTTFPDPLKHVSFYYSKKLQSLEFADTLEEINFGGAKLSQVTFNSSRTSKVSFVRAELIDCFFYNETEHSDLDFTHATLKNCRFPKVTFHRAKFNNATLDTVDFRGATFVDAEFVQATFIGVNLREASLQGADFSYAKLNGTDLCRADIRGITCDMMDLLNLKTLYEAKMDDPLRQFLLEGNPSLFDPPNDL